jgi:phosphoribosylamine--glycine ligase
LFKTLSVNTGGMGTVSPALTISTPEFTERVLNKVIIPTLEGLKAEGISYCGFIFFGLMNVNNHPYVIEYNCRLGDPETESIMLRIESDLIELFVKTAKKELTPDAIQISNDCAATVIIASKGYPEKFDKGFEIIVEQDKIQSHLFYAGTAIKDGRLVNNGGRVMAVSSLGKTLQEALDISYQSIQHIHFENMYYRRDIGQDILKRLNTV